MQQLLVYKCKVIIVSVLLYSYYSAILKNKSFHHYNRFYLLAIIPVSLLLPLCSFTLFTVESSSAPALGLMNMMYAAGGEEEIITHSGFSLSWQNVAAVICILVSAFFLIRLAARTVSILSLKSKYPVIKMQEFDFVNTDLPQAPFSFFNNIFWRNNIETDEENGKRILHHEIIHVKQKHSLDKIFMQFVLCFCWMNPVFWLIQRELSLIHEFIADEESAGPDNTHALAGMLLTAQFGHSIFSPAQSFFYSPIKRRLVMLTTSKKTNFSYARKLLALPLLAAIVALFAFRLQSKDTVIKSSAPFKLMVDAGHGGDDIGAKNIDGSEEKNFTLAIAQKIKSLGNEYGIDVMLSRASDLTLTPAQRVEIAAQQKPDAFVSIHVNAAPENEAASHSGFEILVSNNNDNGLLSKSRMLGSGIGQALTSSFSVTPFILQKEIGVWVLQKNTVPAALVECGYITDDKDLKMLKDDKQIETMARKILEGVALYANNKTSYNKDGKANWQKDTALYNINIYNGMEVKKTVINAVEENVTITLTNEKEIKLSLDEAVKAHLVQRVYHPQVSSDKY